jgi:hypothetical protein
MIVLCTGMVRRGSTWSYNACKELLAAAFPGAAVDGLYAEQIGDAIAAHAAADHLVIKCHGADDAGHRLIESGRCRQVYTYRDPREAAASGIAAFGHPLHDMIGMIRQSFQLLEFQLADGDPLLIAYRTLLDDPAGALAAVAAHLRLPLGAPELGAVASRISRDALSAIATNIEAFDEGELHRDEKYLLHRATLIHRRHFRPPGAGWDHVLSGDEAREVEEALAPWRQWWEPAAA